MAFTKPVTLAIVAIVLACVGLLLFAAIERTNTYTPILLFSDEDLHLSIITIGPKREVLGKGWIKVNASKEIFKFIYTANSGEHTAILSEKEHWVNGRPVMSEKQVSLKGERGEPRLLPLEKSLRTGRAFTYGASESIGAFFTHKIVLIDPQSHAEFTFVRNGDGSCVILVREGLPQQTYYGGTVSYITLEKSGSKLDKI